MENPFEAIQKQLTHLEGLVSELLSRPATSVNQAERALSAEEAAPILGIALGTIYQNISVIPHRKRHGRLYFFETELLAYLKAKPEKGQTGTIRKPRKRASSINANKENAGSIAPGL